jgi:hypothetical protein
MPPTLIKAPASTTPQKQTTQQGDFVAQCGRAMAKTTGYYFFLNRVAQMQRVIPRGAPARRRLVQEKQQTVGFVCPKFSHDGRAICSGIDWGG